MCDGKLFFCTGDADIEQSAFFFDIAFQVRGIALTRPHQEYDTELQTLGAMQGD